MQLDIQDFAQIRSASINLGKPGDLTILVGPQATGKSLILQWLKLACDPLAVREDWERFGSNWKTNDKLRPLDLFFGEGLGAGYRSTTRVALDGKNLSLETLFNRPAGRRQASEQANSVESVYYIPAHRALLLADGWPRYFQQHIPGTPYVARAQSERLARWLGEAKEALFPVSNRLPQELRTLFDEAIFHSAELNVDRSSPQSRLVLKIQRGSSIPYMAWTAGQREFVPLLIALYELLPSGKKSRLQQHKTVVLEEPELGLHPKALFAVGIGVLHLLARGYRVVISSHSPLVVDFAWGLNRLRQAKAHGKATDAHFMKAFDLRGTASNKALVKKLEQTQARTYYLCYEKTSPGKEPHVSAKDISSLQTYSDDADQSSWGELLKYSSRLADVIGQLDLDFSSLPDEDAKA